MKLPRLYNRIKPVGRVTDKAQIILGAKLPLVECRLVDYAPGGACLELFPMVTLPERFEVRYGNVKKKCRIVWRRGIRIGVAF